MYSQQDEERYILEITANVKQGRLLDIGAFNGKDMSNTLALIEKGWSGILVEPSPEAFITLLQRHGSNPKLMLIHAAVGFDHHMVKFWNAADLVSTLDEAHYNKWKDQATYNDCFYVPTVTIGDITNQFDGGFDFVNIDAEGISADLFIRMPLEAITRGICVEHDSRIIECTQHAEKSGFKMYHLNGTNAIYARS